MMTRGDLRISFSGGDSAAFEVGRAVSDRPIVYLDQNHWVDLAKCMYSPGLLNPQVRAACEAVTELARDGRIVLPLSGAHLVETSRRRGRSRRDLAMTMLQLSRGWQMRTPLDVRQSELRAELSCHGASPRCPLGAPAVFTLEPGALFVDNHQYITMDPQDWPERLCFVFLDDEPVDDSRGRELAELWAVSHQELAKYQRSVAMPKEHIRINARARLLVDLGLEACRAAHATGLEPAELTAWMTRHSEDSIARMPYVGRLQEVLWHRLSNADEKWKPNDLNDAHFLACAAAYADVVVGERATIEYLRRAERRCVPGAHACRTINEACAHLAVP